MTGRYKTHKMTAEVLLNRQSFPLVIFKPIVVIFGIFSWLLCRANFNFRRYLVQKNWNFNLRINAIVRDKVQWVENGWEWCWRHLAYVTQLSEWVRARLSSAFAIFWSVASKPEREFRGLPLPSCAAAIIVLTSSVRCSPAAVLCRETSCNVHYFWWRAALGNGLGGKSRGNEVGRGVSPPPTCTHSNVLHIGSPGLPWI